MRTETIFALLATTLAASLLAGPAQATLRERVFVASYGSDSNPCTFGSPCKTFQNALTAVAAGGEITAIDSAGFGPVTINKAVTITSPNGVEAGIAAAAGDSAITIQAGTNDAVVLSGLTLEGAGTAAQGILFSTGAQLQINNCSIRNYSNDGILIDASAALSLLISNTIISDNGNYGVQFNTASAGSIIAAFDEVTINNNKFGIASNAQGNSVEATIANSHIDNNIDIGIDISGSSTSITSNFILKDVTLNQTSTAIFLAQNSNVWLSGVTQESGAGLGTTSINFFSGGAGNNVAYSDMTSHLMGTMFGGGLTPWATQ
jgi:hypothetical protein